MTAQQKEPHPLDEVYERFKHLDIFLSDEKSCAKAGEEISPAYLIMGDMWRAIKGARVLAAKEQSAEQRIQDVIAELESTIKCNERWQNLEPYYRGVNAGAKITISLLRDGVKK